MTTPKTQNKPKDHKEVTVSVVPPTPATLLQLAVNQGADLEKLEKLMELQERWEANEARKAYVVAMAAFHAECPVIEKTKQAHNSKYAGLAETLEAVRPSMSKNGMTPTWKITQDENRITIECCITHIAGHKECTSMSGAPDTSGSKNAIQAQGSTQEYLRRYTFFALAGIASREMDDDGRGSEPPEEITSEQVDVINDLQDKAGIQADEFARRLKKKYGVEDTLSLNTKQAAGLIIALKVAK